MRAERVILAVASILACSVGMAGCAMEPVADDEIASIEQEIVATPDVSWVARHGMSPAQYQAQFNQWVDRGFRLVDVSGFSTTGSPSFAAIWEKAGSAPWVARHGLTSAQYQAQFDHWVGLGYRLMLVEGYDTSGGARFAAIWQKSSTPAWVARHGLSSAQYQAQFDDLVGRGYRLVHVSGYTDRGQVRYAAIWDRSRGGAWVARHGMTSAQYQAQFNHWVGQGYRLALVDGYGVGGSDRYAAIWERSASSPWVARHGMSSATYQAEFDKWVGQGYRLVLVSGYDVGGSARYAALWRKL